MKKRTHGEKGGGPQARAEVPCVHVHRFIIEI
jgi:hypothetical protein